jgi:hypothetical protein
LNQTILPMKDRLPKVKDFPPLSVAPAKRWQSNHDYRSRLMKLL